MVQIANNLELVLQRLDNSHYSNKIIANFKAYSDCYDFCRFYEIIDNTKVVGLINLFNSSMVISVFDLDDVETIINDICIFVNINKPNSIEGQKCIVNKLALFVSQYSKVDRAYFKFEKTLNTDNLIIDKNPSFDKVFDVLKDGFDSIKNNYAMWLTDVSHRVRRNQSFVYLYNDCSTATVQYILDNKAFVGLVATKKDKRGKGYAKKLLNYICNEFMLEDIETFLLAREERIGFYKEIGFKELSRDLILERNL